MKIVKISSKNLNEAVRVIKKGGVVVCPTDTVYGLVADAKNKTAVKNIFEIKKRSFKKPLPIFIKDLKMAKALAKIDKKQEKIIKKCWPGKVTVILKAKLTKFPKGIISKDKEIGLRNPDYKFLNILLEKLDRPLAETSANISGKRASTKIKEVLKQFEKQRCQPNLVLDAGNLRISLPSTVVDLIDFKILRKGEVSKDLILR